MIGVLTRYGLTVRESYPRGGEIFRPVLGPAQPPVQWVSSFFPGGKAAGAWP